jgi:hypothetical protein
MGTKFWLPEGKRSVGRSRHRWEDNIETDPRDIRLEGVDWIDFALDRWWALVNMVMNLRVP